jgi:hypothetical protein
VSGEVKITERGATPKTTKREINNAAREAVRTVGDAWFAYYAEKHFTHRGATEYGYPEPNPYYNLRKLKTKGHTYPMVWSGKTRADVMGNTRVEATATKGTAKARVVINASGLNLRSPKSKIDLRRQMVMVSDAEVESLEDVGKVSLAKQLKASNN